MGDYLFLNITDLLQKYHKTSINPSIKNYPWMCRYQSKIKSIMDGLHKKATSNQ